MIFITVLFTISIIEAYECHDHINMTLQETIGFYYIYSLEIGYT